MRSEPTGSGAMMAADMISLLERAAVRLPADIRDDVVQTVAERLARRAARGDVVTLTPGLAAMCTQNAGVDRLKHEATFRKMHQVAARTAGPPTTAEPEEAVLLRETYTEFVAIVSESLTEMELRIFWLRLEGLKSQQIAEVVGKSDGGQVRNILRRIVKKLSQRMMQVGSTILVEELLRAFGVHHH